MSYGQTYNYNRYFAKRYQKQALNHIEKSLEYLMRLKLMYENGGHPEIAEKIEKLMETIYALVLSTKEWFDTL